MKGVIGPAGAPAEGGNAEGTGESALDTITAFAGLIRDYPATAEPHAPPFFYPTLLCPAQCAQCHSHCESCEAAGIQLPESARRVTIFHSDGVTGVTESRLPRRRVTMSTR